MIDLQSTDFKMFLSALTERFGGSNKKNLGRTILVDLSHDWIEYLLYALLLAKMEQHLNGGRIVAFSFHTKVVEGSCGGFNFDIVTCLAKAFGVDDLICLSRNDFQSWTDAHQKTILDYINGLKATFGDKPNSAYFEKQEGLQIRHCIYESVLRGNRVAAFAGFDDPKFFQATAEVLHVQNIIEHIFSTQRVGAVIIGHIDYNPWRLVAERAKIEKISPLYFYASKHFHLYKLDHHLEKTLGENREDANIKSFLELAKNPLFFDCTNHLHSTLGFASELSGLEPMSYALTHPMLKSYIQQNLKTQFGWNEDKPVYTLFAHTFSDIPLCGPQAFDDLAQWFLETLAFAIKDTEHFWVIKPHPRDSIYDTTGFIQTLAKYCKDMPHIQFVGEQFSFTEILAITDLAITVRGTIGIEAPMYGVSTLGAGQSPYAGAGFLDITTQKEDYFTSLKNHTQAMNPSRVLHAKAFFVFDQFIGHVQSNAFANLASSFVNIATFFRNSIFCLQNYVFAQDPLFEAFKTIKTKPNARAIRPNFYPTTTENASNQIQKNEIFLTAHSTDQKYLIGGFHKPEDFCVWTNRSHATFCVPFASEAEHIKINFWGRVLHENQKVVLRAPNGKETTLDFSADDFKNVECVVNTCDFSLNEVLLFELVVSHVYSPAQLAINTDPRVLGVCIHNMSLQEVRFNASF